MRVTIPEGFSADFGAALEDDRAFHMRVASTAEGVREHPHDERRIGFATDTLAELRRGAEVTVPADEGRDWFCGFVRDRAELAWHAHEWATLREFASIAEQVEPERAIT
jgi:hypothetical protein